MNNLIELPGALSAESKKNIRHATSHIADVISTFQYVERQLWQLLAVDDNDKYMVDHYVLALRIAKGSIEQAMEAATQSQSLVGQSITNVQERK